MSNPNDGSFFPALLRDHYGLTLQGAPFLLNERDGQQVFKLLVSEGSALILRLCTAARPKEKVLADTAMLRFLTEANFPAPHLRLTKDGQEAFEWQPNCWAYVTDFVEGEHPQWDLPTLDEVGRLLGGLSSLVDDPETIPAKVGWLDDLPTALRRALDATRHPQWGLQANEIVQSLNELPVYELRMLPQGLLHTDVHEGNLVRTAQGQLYLLDWEDAGLGEAIFDLAEVLGWNCVWQHPAALLNPAGQPDRYDFDEQACRTVLRSYQRVRPLTPSEARLLGPAVRYLNAWFAARDIEREIARPGVTEGLAFTFWAIMRSVTPEWSERLATWAGEEAAG